MTKFLTVLAVLVLAGLVYVYQEVEALKIGYQIRQAQEQKMILMDRQRVLKYNLARLKAPRDLERRLLSQRIQLEAPASWRTLFLSEPSRKAWGLWGSTQGIWPGMERLWVGTAQAEAKESS